MIPYRNCICLLAMALGIGVSSASAQGSVTRLEENDPSIVYSGGWYVNTASGNSGGSAALTNTTGASVVVTFTGTAISWIGVSDRWNGLATVTLDGQPYKVDGYADTTYFQVTLFSATGLSAGPHKLSIEINHERGPYGQGSWVWVDAFDVWNGGGISGGLPPAGVGRIENTNPALTYSGNWYTNNLSIHSGGSAVLAVNPGASVTLNFNGTGVAWVTYRDEWSGLARVYIDGQLRTTIDCYLTPSQAQTVPFSIQGLPSGPHSITIEVTGTRNPNSGGAWVWLDAIDVLQ